METATVPRASINALLHAAVDSELKSLKIISRRLQAALAVHKTEARILQRLLYKNKNQHRGALFWRNVTEMRRYSERLERSKPFDSLQLLRSKFYASDSQSLSSMKGSWTRFSDPESLSICLKKFQMVETLTLKMSEACSRAYASFHRSMQSAAFLQMLLTFVAVSSRSRIISLEVNDVSQQAVSCLKSLLSILERSRDTPAETEPTTHDVVSHTSQDFSPTVAALEYVATQNSGNPVASPRLSRFEAKTTTHIHTKSIVVQSKTTPKTPRRPKGLSSANTSRPPNKKRPAKNEIDDIFGF